MDDRTLSSLAPKLCNSLLSEIWNAESLSVFKTSLKNYFISVINLFYNIGFVFVWLVFLLPVFFVYLLTS